MDAAKCNECLCEEVQFVIVQVIAYVHIVLNVILFLVTILIWRQGHFMSVYLPGIILMGVVVATAFAVVFLFGVYTETSNLLHNGLTGVIIGTFMILAPVCGQIMLSHFSTDNTIKYCFAYTMTVSTIAFFIFATGLCVTGCGLFYASELDKNINFNPPK